jgi:hypothetical protein
MERGVATNDMEPKKEKPGFAKAMPGGFLAVFS